MADTVQVRFSASIKDLIEATNSVKSAIDGVVEKAQAAGEAMKTFGEIAGIGLSVEAVRRFVESMAELGEKTEQIGARLGLSAEQVGILGGVAKLGGVDIDTLATSFERMSLNVQKSTKDAFNPAAQGLRVLGLNARELIGLPADEYFRRIAAAVAQFNPSLNLTNALTAVGGRGITQMMFALREAGTSWDEWTEKIKQTGSVLTDQQAHAFAIP